LLAGVQAVEEIHQLKDAVYKEQGRVRDLIQQVNKLSNKVSGCIAGDDVSSSTGLTCRSAIDLISVESRTCRLCIKEVQWQSYPASLDRCHLAYMLELATVTIVNRTG
jgi:hypothetical protein